VRADVARGPDASASIKIFTYAYDALGRRVAKSDVFGTTHFAWDGDQMALERRGQNEVVHLYHPESFVPLAQIHDGVLHHLHTDHMGTPLEASNDAGEISWRVTYRTWGNVVSEEVAEIQQRVRFQGQYFDAETGLYYNQFRYFDPDVGRFVSQDPIGLLGGDNLYQYAANPTAWIVPFGLVGIHGVHNGWLSNGLHGDYGKNVELKFEADDAGNIPCSCVFGKDKVPKRKKDVRKAKEEALASLQNPKVAQKALAMLEGGTMVITTTDFYSGKIPEQIFNISYFKESDDFAESKIDILYRVMHGNMKMEVSFFKDSKDVNYIQMEQLGSGDNDKRITLVDDCNIFEGKDSKWVNNNLGEKGERIKLYFDDENILYSLTYE